MRKIDVFTHIWPDAYYKALRKLTGEMTDITRRSESVPMITDLDRRFEVMDMFNGYQQILSLASPSLELVANPREAQELSRIGSESMAELCERYPDRFPGFIATVPLTTPDAGVAEARHAIETLGACGVQVYSSIGGKPLDRPEFAPLLDYMAEIDLPIWIHPARGAGFSDYAAEEKSLYEIWWTFGWPYETSAAMARLVFSKTLDRLPGLKVITHHAGGMVPFFEGRVAPAATSSAREPRMPTTASCSAR
jgi:aminocarboxymuconate-semialdehyde decarboxylase